MRISAVGGYLTLAVTLADGGVAPKAVSRMMVLDTDAWTALQ